ncbi:hypothetical protein BYT27DRAFT_7203424 [Phlegmacium glaucopus]|nr:hypothetical protein BYT27DRAFT_7203424 [Phlegmacium glaucopus]
MTLPLHRCGPSNVEPTHSAYLPSIAAPVYHAALNKVAQLLSTPSTIHHPPPVPY